jgi:GalNAc5-diNAcBac-PP-undecaprenol beta-1,3-glucosyltransferase
MKKIPLISLIIPTHCRGQLLARALKSVNCQHLRNVIEVILISDVIDDLTDAVSKELLSSNDIYIRRNGLPGPADSRNIGLKLATGKYIMFLDDDDSWCEDFTSELTSQLSNFNGLVGYMNCKVVKESRRNIHPDILSESILDLKDKLNNNVFVKNQIHMSCYIFSRSILSGLKFDSSLRAYEDWDFQLSVIEREMPIHLPILCSCIYEVDDDSTDRRGSSVQATDFNAVLDYLTIYRKHAISSGEVKLSRRNLLDKVGLTLHENLL